MTMGMHILKTCKYEGQPINKLQKCIMVIALTAAKIRCCRVLLVVEPIKNGVRKLQNTRCGKNQIQSIYLSSFKNALLQRAGETSRNRTVT